MDSNICRKFIVIIMSLFVESLKDTRSIPKILNEIKLNDKLVSWLINFDVEVCSEHITKRECVAEYLRDISYDASRTFIFNALYRVYTGMMYIVDLSHGA